MLKITKTDGIELITHIAHWLICICALVLSSAFAKDHSYLLFALQLILFYYSLFKTGSSLLFLSPIALLVTYIDVTCALGNYAFSHDIVANKKNYIDFLQWKYTNFLSAYVLIVNYVLFIIDCRFHHRYLYLVRQLRPSEKSKKSLRKLLFVSGIGFVVFSFLSLDLSFIGGLGDLAVIPRTIAALILIYYVGSRRFSYRYLIYIIILGIFAAVCFSNKREAIFLVFPIALVEALYGQRKLKLKSLIVAGIAVSVIILLILTMTIYRGYDNYQPVRGDHIGNFQRSLPYLFDYISSDTFIAHFLLNIETSYTYFHSMQAMEFIADDPNLLTYGTTIAKVFFIGIPSSLATFKPSTFVHLYTMEYDPAFRMVGGSWASNIYAEAFWNYSYAGIFYIIFAFYILNRFFVTLLSWVVYGKIMERIWIFYAYMQVLSFARGSGTDGYAIDIIVGLIFTKIYVVISNIWRNEKDVDTPQIKTLQTLLQWHELRKAKV